MLILIMFRFSLQFTKRRQIYTFRFVSFQWKWLIRADLTLADTINKLTRGDHSRAYYRTIENNTNE